jgi:hypothetical protein
LALANTRSGDRANKKHTSEAAAAVSLVGAHGAARLPSAIAQAIPAIGEHETEIVMHNDAVVQGLSEVPFLTDVERWGVLTLGTGLGNARFYQSRCAEQRREITPCIRVIVAAELRLPCGVAFIASKRGLLPWRKRLRVNANPSAASCMSTSMAS